MDEKVEQYIRTKLSKLDKVEKCFHMLDRTTEKLNSFQIYSSFFEKLNDVLPKNLRQAEAMEAQSNYLTKINILNISRATTSTTTHRPLPSNHSASRNPSVANPTLPYHKFSPVPKISTIAFNPPEPKKITERKSRKPKPSSEN